MKTPILETSRLWLKPLKEEDAPGAFLWTGDPKVSWYMRYETHGSLEDTKQWLREEEKQLDSDLLYDFGFHKKDSDELIGSGGLTFNQQQGIWELGYNLRRDCWNQGYGTEAAAAILSFAENTLHIHRVMARRAKDNTASGRVLEKNGFSFVRECWDQKWSGSHRFECREYIWKSEKEEEKNSAARNEVERFYDDEYEEWDRLEWHTPEFEVTKRYMEEYIPGDTPQKILDIGGGPGQIFHFSGAEGT